MKHHALSVSAESGRSCSHVLVWVKDIHRAVADYRRLGFIVDYATAPDKAQHAHIWFTRGPVIELLTTPRYANLLKWPIDLWAGRGAGRRMLRWPAEGEGFCDVAVAIRGADLSRDLEALRSAGIPVGRQIRWTRKRPDGDLIRFQFAYPRHDRLPFLVTPYDPPQHPKTIHHPNAAASLTRVRMGVAPSDRAAWEQIVGGDPVFEAEVADTTQVIAVEIAGLQAPLDAALLHGAVLQAASDGRSSMSAPNPPSLEKEY